MLLSYSVKIAAQTYLQTSRECINCANDLRSFNYFDLKDKPQVFFDKSFAFGRNLTAREREESPEQVAGDMVSLLALDETNEITKIKKDLEEFLEWFAKIVEKLALDFTQTNPEFDFVKASKNPNNEFINWIEENFGSDVKLAFAYIGLGAHCLNYYAEKKGDFRTNPVKQMLDKVFDKKVTGSFDLKTILQALQILER